MSSILIQRDETRLRKGLRDLKRAWSAAANADIRIIYDVIGNTPAETCEEGLTMFGRTNVTPAYFFKAYDSKQVGFEMEFSFEQGRALYSGVGLESRTSDVAKVKEALLGVVARMEDGPKMLASIQRELAQKPA
ncbi:MAG: hypothetical protein GC136_00675 [Alphaproteobacteria bacterium]|nr:hypothetical protein [Alphaproteobacteria bacterium]